MTECIAKIDPLSGKVRSVLCSLCHFIYHLTDAIAYGCNCKQQCMSDMQLLLLYRGWVLFSGLRQQLLAESPAQPLPIDVLNGECSNAELPGNAFM